jgi:hypothetical protein
MTSRAFRSLLLAPLLAIALSVPSVASAGASVQHRAAPASTGQGTTSPGRAGAQGPGWAEYDGRQIDLAAGWGSAHACWVSHQATSTSTQCYASAAAMSEAIGVALPSSATGAGATGSPATGATTAAAGSSGASGSASPATGAARPLSETCGSGQVLYLYSGQSFSGNVLGISQANVWIDLASYGFADEMSSWINDSSCPATGEHTLGGSDMVMGARSSSSYVGPTWNHQVVWVCLEG